MKIKNKHIIFMIILFVTTNGISQDIHFSQFFANPVSYNPANTGFFKGKYRIGINHKEQWPWAIKGKYTNYNTTSAYADFTVLDKKFNKVDWAGIGLNFINDQSGDGALRTNKIFLALAYHKGLDRFHKHFISMGFTLAYIDKSINFKELFFNNQWKDRVGFIKELPNYEDLSTEKFSYLDLGVGIQGRNIVTSSLKLTYGITLLHINKPKETFYNSDNRLNIRYLAHLNMEYKMNEKLNIMGSGYYTFQNESTEILFGALLSYELQDNINVQKSKIFAGVFYRINDAISPIVGYQFHKTRVLMNFDFNLSSLSKISKGDGGFEISLIHVGNWSNKTISQRKMNCYEF